MRLSDLSIERPVLATVLSLLIVVAGGVSFFGLPVRELPDVDRPLVSATTTYLGASPETVESTITEPLEQVLNGIEGIRSIDSTSAFGQSAINVEFEAGRDIDVAATDVSNAILRAVDLLPADARRPVVRKAGANARPIMWINVHGDDYSPVDLSDFADRIVRTPLQLLPGVARAVIGGERRYAMRVWLDPARMAAHGVDALDVRQAIRESNLQLPAGELEALGRKFTINADARIEDPAVFERVVIREDGDIPVRIGDVGWVELGSENYQAITRFYARDVVGVGIVRQSRANELEISSAVREELPEIGAALPEGAEVSVAVDFTRFVREALKEVTITLAIAFAIVVLVNLVFLRSPTTTTITVAVIPVALVGTLAGLAALGFSLNILTLLALVLSVGLLVDDAIVVQENIYRRQEGGEPPLRAAVNGAREVGFPVIATTAAVVAVLIPLSMMSGNTGRLFREFAITMAIAVSISTFVALTLVPMLCSRYLSVGEHGGALGRVFESGLERLRDGYARVLDLLLRHRWLVGLLLAGVVIANVALFQSIPSTFLPIEDRGRFFVLIRAPEGATSAYTRRALARVEEELLAIPEIQGFFAAIGMGFGAPSSSSVGMVFTSLVDWNERTVKQQEIVSRLFPKFMDIPEAMVFAINPPSLSQRSNSDVEVVIKSSSASLDEFAAVNQSILGAMRELPGLVNVDSDLRLENPQLDIRFDRDRAADIGVPVSAVSESLRLLVSQGPADDFILRNKRYEVVTALSSPFRSIPENLGEVHVRARDGSMVALSSLITPQPRIAPTWLNHYNLQRSATLSANLAQGAALGSALDRVQAIVREALPSGFSSELGGTSREFVEAGAQIYATFAIALLVIYLVLAAQFESFLDPLTVMLSVPLAVLGALLAIALTDGTLDLYSQIGIILLVGLVTKNAILLVDFANQERARGTELTAALLAAGRTRFRPILMTSVTSILGAMPLALASSAGAESRQAIGVAVVGGLLFSTAFTLVMIPVVHFAVVRLGQRLGPGAAPPRGLATGMLVAFSLWVGVGCYPHWGPVSYSTARLFGSSDLPEDEIGSPPLLRLGGLPYPYLIFPTRIADPSRLGRHEFLTLSRPPLRLGEKSSGIVYTRRGGFLDIAHLRNTADLVKYAHGRVLAGLRERRREILLVSSEPSFYRVAFSLDAERAASSAVEWARLEEEIAIRLAQRLGFFMTTWHEVLTFYGYRSGLVVPERQSAFVWDDQPSHMVGALVAGEALRRGGDFDAVLSEVVDEWMVALDARPPGETRDAVASVEGTWWRSDRPPRLVHLGVGDEPMVPFLLPGDPADRTARWHLPTLANVEGRDLRPGCRVTIEPRTRAARSLYAALGSEPRPIAPDEDFPRLEEVIRGEGSDDSPPSR